MVKSNISAKTYKITQYSYSQARKLGVTIKRSTNPKKKIDVYKLVKRGKRDERKGDERKRDERKRDERKIVSIGAMGYGDYPTFMNLEGNKSAKIHRKRYKMRHEKDRHRKGTAGYYADKILW